MQLLKSNCPYCSHEVETTIDHLEEPIVCPSCHKPFEIEIPSVQVSSVRDVDMERDSETATQLAGRPEEQKLFEVHPVVFRARPFSTLLLVAVIAACLYALWMSFSDQAVAWLAWVGGAGLLAAVGMIGFWMLRSAFTTLTITDDRTILQRGIIARDTSEVQHDDVRNIQLDQSFFERMLGVGDIGISSSGQDDLEIVARRLPNPGKLVEAIRRYQE